MQAANIFDFSLSIATPKGYEPSQSYVDKYQNNIEYFNKPLDACIDADIIVTDVWTSMGQESRTKRARISV